MTDSIDGAKINTLIALIQWRVDENISLKDAYNYVITNFREGVTEDERQAALNHFMPSA